MKATFVLYHDDDATLALSEHAVETFVLPEEGSAYWWRDPFRVRRIEPGNCPTVELVRDREREGRYRSDLPPGVALVVGRASDSEQWHATVFEPGGDVRAHVDFCETGDEAAERARVEGGLPKQAPGGS